MFSVTFYLCSIFDASIDRYHVYKVETISDSYMVASGLPVVFPEHAVELAKLAIELRDSVDDFIIPHLHEALHLRIGIHTGLFTISSLISQTIDWSTD